MIVHAYKYQGAGNDFVIFDNSLGMLQFAEKKELQQKIDLKVEEKDAVYNALKTTKEKLAEMKQLFPDAYAIKAELDQLEEKLIAIENKFL